MSSNLSSSDLKAKALIDTLKNPQRVSDNYLVKYIVTQPPETDLQIVEVVNRFATSDTYKTSILENAYPTPIAPIQNQPEKKTVSTAVVSAYQVEVTSENNGAESTWREYCCQCLGLLFGTPYHG